MLVIIKIILQVGCEKLRHFIQQGNNSKVSVFKIDDCHHHLTREFCYNYLRIYY